MKFVAPCLFGVESLSAEEFRSMGFDNVRSENGRILFEGNYSLIPRANICSRFAERILILAGEFKAKTFEALFNGVYHIDWCAYLSSKDAFPVKGWSINSTLHSIPDCQKIIKKAIAEKLGKGYGVRWLEESGPVHQIRFSILKDCVSIMIDTTGIGLHKRGYRPLSNAAPIKETLAAAMCSLARLKDYHTLYDPFCGSGTILIEGTMLSNHIMPGFKRSFSCEKWGSIDKKVWQSERTRALDGIKRSTDFVAFGSDIDPNCIELTERNARRFGLSKKINLKVADFQSFSPKTEKGTLITNPPYGERLLDVQVAEQIYKDMGDIFADKYGWSYNIITPNEDFETIFGRKARKRRKLYNGMIKCTYFSYF